jgi:hypothetical protein
LGEGVLWLSLHSCHISQFFPESLVSCILGENLQTETRNLFQQPLLGLVPELRLIDLSAHTLLLYSKQSATNSIEFIKGKGSMIHGRSPGYFFAGGPHEED